MYQASGKKRAKLTGKGKDHSFLLLTHNMMDSQAWLGLSGSAVKLLLEIARQYNGFNNGDISVPISRMRKRGFNSSDVLSRCKKELIAAGLVTQTRQGGMHYPSLFSVTWLPINECGGKLEVAAEKVASHAWKKSNAQAGIRCDSLSVAPESGAIAA